MATPENHDEVETLRGELARSQGRERALQAEVALYKAALDGISDSINIRGSDHQHLYANPTALEWMNVARIEDIEHAERRWRYLQEDEQSEVKLEETPTWRVLSGDIGDGTVTTVALHIDEATGARRWLRGAAAPIYAESGEISAVVNLVRDITTQRANEQALALRTQQLRERDTQKAGLIGELEELVLELSAPALEVWDGILVVPVLGPLDARRGRDLLEGTLDAVQHHRSRVVIVDLTGATVDTATSAEQLARLTRALAFLGAECVLAGIRPALARFLVEQDLAARGAMPRAASLGLFAEGSVAETCSTPGTAAMDDGRRLAPDENSGARRHDALHHGLRAPAGVRAYSNLKHALRALTRSD